MAGGVAVMPVVKADAYGHGMIAVARALSAAGADALCVATLDEALALRNTGIDREVIVLYPVPVDGLGDARDSDITVTAGEPVLSLLASRPGAAGDTPLPRLELEIETGLGRGGVKPADAADAMRTLLEAGAEVMGAWSHLQASDVESITRGQVAAYEDGLSGIAAAGLSVGRRHLAASAAILLDNVPRYDAVRPGLITYGLVPDELGGRSGVANRFAAGAEGLGPALSVVARPVRVAELEAGHGVSYGPTWRAARPSRIATLPIGYGDGWPRSLSNRGEVLVRGVRAPVVGNVAMDATMVDVTDVPGHPVDVEDEFVLIGRQGTAEIRAGDVAQWRNTNSWEVVTALSGRLTRVYHAAAGLVRP
jgi:alanine racemase